MSLVSERIQAAKGPEKPVDPKKQILNNNKDLDVDMKKDEPSFFSTFFPAGAKGVPKKKGVSVMESVSRVERFSVLFFSQVFPTRAWIGR